MSSTATPGEIWQAALHAIRRHMPRRDGTRGRCLTCPPVGPCALEWWAHHERLRREAQAAARLAALRLAERPTTPPA